MKTKLDILFENPSFLEGSIDAEPGFIILEDELYTFLLVKYPDKCKAFLSVFEEDAPDDHLIIVEAATLEKTQKLAEEKLKSIVLL